MLTIKLKLKSTLSNEFFQFQKKWNNVYRYSYNRFTEGIKLFDLYPNLNKLNNVEILDESWKRTAAQQANYLFKAKSTSKVIFGGKKNFNKLKNKKISIEEFNKLKNIKITMTGSKYDPHGNRKFKFNVDNFTGSVKLINTINFETIIPAKSQINLLTKALILADENKLPITYSLDENYLYVSFEELNLNNDIEYNPVKNRCLAIDINPNYIGYSIVDENNKQIFKEVISLKSINNKNKKKHELFQISKYIINIAKYYKVEIIGFEKLNIKAKEHNKGRIFNKMVNNDWCRNLFINSIKKHCNLSNIKFQEIVANYSSFIGCINNPNDTDSVAASLELNRRLLLFKKIYLDVSQEKVDIIYPKWDIYALSNRWKEEAKKKNISSWKGLYQLCKNTKYSYRILYDEFKSNYRVFRFKSESSLVDKIPYLN